MKVYRNTKEMTKKETIGRRFSMTGLLVLMIGMLASFIPSWYPPGTPAPNSAVAFLQQYWALASFIALPAGFLCASVGSYFINRFARRRWPGSKVAARPDEVLERSMKGFDDKYAYFVHSLPAAYVLAGPCGVLIFALRSDRTQVTVQGDRWREKFSLGRFFTVFAREGLGNPPRDLADQAVKIKALLEGAKSQSSDAAGAALADVPIDGAAIFLNDATQLEIDGPNIPVLRPDQVKEFVRRKARDVKLSNQTIRVLQEVLRENSTYQEE